MTVVLRPLPVLFACQGCPAFGDTARDVGQILERRRLVESHWLGVPAPHDPQLAQSRFPVFALDGCPKQCTQRWLSSRGVKTQRHFILAAPGDSAEQIAERIAARIAA